MFLTWLTMGAMGLSIQKYLHSSATWSSAEVSRSSGFVLLNIRRGIVLINALQLLNTYILDQPSSSNCSL